MLAYDRSISFVLYAIDESDGSAFISSHIQVDGFVIVPSGSSTLYETYGNGLALMWRWPFRFRRLFQYYVPGDFVSNWV